MENWDENIIINVDGKQSIRIYDDFIIDMSDWELLRSEIDNNIKYWNEISISYTHLNSTKFDCQLTLLNERKYRLIFEREAWDTNNASLYVYMHNKRNYFGFDVLDWETLKSNIDKVFWNKECSF